MCYSTVIINSSEDRYILQYKRTRYYLCMYLFIVIIISSDDLDYYFLSQS